jgi:hypothetical protein
MKNKSTAIAPKDIPTNTFKGSSSPEPLYKGKQ